jgi:hypothetical protein
LIKKRIDVESAKVSPIEGHAIGEQSPSNAQTSIFHWEDLSYDIEIRTEKRRILDNVDGWVKPGTLTALMVGLVRDLGPRIAMLTFSRVSLVLEKRRSLMS